MGSDLECICVCVCVDVSTPRLFVFQLFGSEWRKRVVSGCFVGSVAVGGSWFAYLNKKKEDIEREGEACGGEQCVVFVNEVSRTEQIVRVSSENLILGIQRDGEGGFVVVCSVGGRIEAWSPQGRRTVLLGYIGLHDVVEFQQLSHAGSIYSFALSSRSILGVYKDGSPILHPIHLETVLKDKVLRGYYFREAAFFVTQEGSYLLPFDGMMIPLEPQKLPADVIPYMFKNQLVTADGKFVPYRLDEATYMDTTESEKVELEGGEAWKTLFANATITYQNFKNRQIQDESIVETMKRRLTHNQLLLKMDVSSPFADSESHMLIQAFKCGLSLTPLFGKLTPTQRTLCQTAAKKPVSKFSCETSIKVNQFEGCLVLVMEVFLKSRLRVWDVCIVPNTSVGWSACKVNKCSGEEMTCYAIALFPKSEWEKMVDGMMVTPCILWKESGSIRQEVTNEVFVSREQVLSALKNVCVWPWWTRRYSHDYVCEEFSVERMKEVCRVLRYSLGYKQASGIDVGDESIGLLPNSFVKMDGTILLHVIVESGRIRVCFRSISPDLYLSDFLVLKCIVQVEWKLVDVWDLVTIDVIEGIGLDAKSFDVFDVLQDLSMDLSLDS